MIEALRASPLQFAVVREDPRIEQAVLRELQPRRILLIGSGGCTALHLRACFPELDITLCEPNAAQLLHVQQKLTDLGNGERAPHVDPAHWNIGSDRPHGLHEAGNFERLFRMWRQVVDLFVLPAAERCRRCADPAANFEDVVQHPYWPAAFAAAFSDELLLAMFGPGAIQHAEPGSYPTYFRRRIEAGLAAADRCHNPWLHHVLLGHYLDEPMAWPPFLREPPRALHPFPSLPVELAAVPSFAPFDFVHLSNVLDWMPDDACRSLARRLGAELRPGAAILWRQLNDSRPLAGYFAPMIRCDAERDARLTHDERSLFYDQVHLGHR